MLESMLLQGLFKVTLALFAVIMARLSLLWFDRWLMPSTFRLWIEENAQDNARALYYGLRLLAVCLLFGLAIS